MPAETTTPLSAVVPDEAVAPLIRGVAVVRELTEAGGTLSLSGLERATGLARSTVDRITSTLARMGYVRLDGRDAVATPRLMELGNAYLAALRLPALLSPRADALADELDESVSLAVADRDGIRFIHQATRRRAMSLSFRIGDLLPAERTAPGPLFASEWTDAEWRAWRARRAADPQDLAFTAVPPRELPFPDGEFERRAEAAGRNGWALDDQLIEPGLVAVSVPVRDPRTARIACVANVVSHTSRHSATDLRDTLLPRLRATVAEMEHELATAPEPDPGPPPSDLASWIGASKHELGRDFIESLARGLTVLTAFGAGRAALTLTDVARATGLARATARRALITYEHLGLVRQQPESRTFTLTPRVLSLGFPPLSRTTLPRIAAPHLADLSARVKESTALAVLVSSGSSTEIQYTARAVSPRIMGVDIRVGTRLPASATSLGRVLLADTETSADLDRVRTQGYALLDEGWEDGLRTLAVPLRDRTGRVVAAVNVALHAAGRTERECVEEILPELRRTATRIEEELHAAGHFTRVPLF
ncbi:MULTISPECIES: IclR family transcriptional regulator C-terminal domain-containing protein [unclassified Streptomyces]|uniref:IclR family transcriptional regulator domain-containing protein n=1 Tax=unclassified Streptomyces TaxID=2593676 RepID=UPI0024747ED9|nr:MULTISPECIES: IclR family transcriptional regulator C-terminal domain-containing protein [unclassified Streptomyces]MDH6450851.1 IclR family pca regulon transcriptional regulator [Streptomyces sp. SAI-119]MDH6498603.1 IclR family pca regulon transcriptional regulator [Streptomyces sp. SAI-149]